LKWLKAIPQARIEEFIPEKPLLHVCKGNHNFGEVTLDIDKYHATPNGGSESSAERGQARAESGGGELAEL